MLKILKNKYESISKIQKATIWFIVCNFILKGISFITVPMFTRLIPPNEYGILSVFSSYEQVILIFATWDIQLGAYQKGIFKYNDHIGLFTTATQCLVNIFTIIVFTIIFLCRKYITAFTGMNGIILLLLFFYLLTEPSYSCWLIRKRTTYSYMPAVTMTLLYSLANILVPLTAIFLFGGTAANKFGATLITSSIICGILYFKYADYSKLLKNKERVKEFWKFEIIFSAPAALHSLSYFLLNQADRVMISKMIGNSEVAFYNIAYSLAYVINIFQISVNQSLLPWRYQMLKEKNYDRINNVTNKLLVLFATCILIFMSIAPEIMRLLFTPDYYEGIWCIPPVAASIFFMFLYTIFVNIESYFEKTIYIMYVSIVCGTVNIILNYICIKQFGYISCGYTTLCSYVLFAIGHYFFMIKTIRNTGISQTIINPVFVVSISLVVIICTIAVVLLYNFIKIRYTILVIILCIILIKQDAIVALLQLFKDEKS